MVNDAMRSLHPIFYANEWLFTHSSKVRIEDYSAWERSGKAGRKFIPFLRMQVGRYTICLRGYKEIWSFLDVLLDRPKRSMVNYLMKGQIENADFVEEIQYFLDSHNMMLAFQCKEGYYRHPNSRKFFSGYEILGTFNVECSYHQFPDSHLRIGEMLMPSFGKAGLSWHKTAILGVSSQYVFVRQDGWVSTHVQVSDETCRPTRGRMIKDERERIDYSMQLAFHLSEYSYRGFAQKPRTNQRLGMYDYERDEYEYGIFLMAQNKLQKK